MSTCLTLPLILPHESGYPRVSEHWYETRDGDPLAMALYERHYSCYHYKDGRTRKLFVGPGARMVLLSGEADALYVWRKMDPRGMEFLRGIGCSVFRNEGGVLSSTLIREACDLAWARWPGERLYTFVDGAAVRSSNPGYCYLRAGWRKCGVTKWNRLVILEVTP